MKLIFNIRVILLVLSFLCGCSSFSPLLDYEKIADKITEKTAKELKAQKNLCLVGTGGQMMDDIQMMAMSFYYYQEVDLKIARELIVHVINEYLSAINNNKEIRPYLHEYPFAAKNVEIRIWIHKPDGSDPALDKIYYISAIDGILTYYLDLPKTYSREAIREETYEEALKETTLDQGFTEEVGQTKDRKCSERAIISEGVTKDGAKANIEVISLEDSMFELNGGGFKPFESLNVILNSSNEILHAQVTAAENGDILPIGMMPAVIGKSGGVCHIDILREEGSIHIKLPWGIEAVKKD